MKAMNYLRFRRNRFKLNRFMHNVVHNTIYNTSGEINIISMVLIIIVVIALVAIFQEEMTQIVKAMFEKIRDSMGLYE